VAKAPAGGNFVWSVPVMAGFLALFARLGKWGGVLGSKYLVFQIFPYYFGGELLDGTGESLFSKWQIKI
jgi:hypothetical protein